MGRTKSPLGQGFLGQILTLIFPVFICEDFIPRFFRGVLYNTLQILTVCNLFDLQCRMPGHCLESIPPKVNLLLNEL